MYGVVGFHLVAQSAVLLRDEQGRQQLVFLRFVAQIVADGLHQIHLALDFHVGLRDVLGTVGIGLRHYLDVGHHRLTLIVGHTAVEALQFTLQRGEALSHVTLRHGGLCVLVFARLLTVFSHHGVDYVCSALLRYVLIFDVDDRGIAVLHANGQLGLTDSVHHRHGLCALYGDGHLVVLHLREVGRGLDLNVADRALQRLSHAACQLVLIFVVVLLQFPHRQLAVLLQVELHAHVVIVV